MRVVVVASILATIALAGLVGCPAEEEEDPCAACTVTEQRNTCVGILRDECDKLPEGSQEHEDCHVRAAAGCEGEGEGEGEGQ